MPWKASSVTRVLLHRHRTHRRCIPRCHRNSLPTRSDRGPFSRWEPMSTPMKKINSAPRVPTTISEREPLASIQAEPQLTSRRSVQLFRRDGQSQSPKYRHAVEVIPIRWVLLHPIMRIGSAISSCPTESTITISVVTALDLVVLAARSRLRRMVTTS